MTDDNFRIERLHAAVRKAGTQVALGRLLGHESGAQVGHMLAGRSPITEKTVAKIEALHGFAGWFDKDRTPAEDKEDAATVFVPVLANRGSMGCGEDALEGDVITGQLPIAASWLERRHLSNLAALHLIHGHGNSMEPTFKDGDLLLVNSAQRDAAREPGVYVLRAGDRLFIKRVVHNIAGEPIIKSDNSIYDVPEKLQGSSPVEVIGRVIWVWKGEKVQ